LLGAGRERLAVEEILRAARQVGGVDIDERRVAGRALIDRVIPARCIERARGDHERQQRAAAARDEDQGREQREHAEAGRRRGAAAGHLGRGAGGRHAVAVLLGRAVGAGDFGGRPHDRILVGRRGRFLRLERCLVRFVGRGDAAAIGRGALVGREIVRVIGVDEGRGEQQGEHEETSHRRLPIARDVPRERPLDVARLRASRTASRPHCPRGCARPSARFG
jgi:hypothetical protein